MSSEDVANARRAYEAMNEAYRRNDVYETKAQALADLGFEDRG